MIKKSKLFHMNPIILRLTILIIFLLALVYLVSALISKESLNRIKKYATTKNIGILLIVLHLLHYIYSKIKKTK